MADEVTKHCSGAACWGVGVNERLCTENISRVLRGLGLLLESGDGHLCGRGPEGATRCWGGSRLAFDLGSVETTRPADAKLGLKGDMCQVIKF